MMYETTDAPAERYPTPPRTWLKQADIPAGQREVLVELWSYGPRWSPGDALPDAGTVRVWPSKARLAADLNRPEGTIDKRIRWLSKHGWIRHDPSRGGWWLAVGAPVSEWCGDAVVAASVPPTNVTHAGGTHAGGGTDGPGTHAPTPRHPCPPDHCK